jgi:hypothetical protein
MSHSLEKDPTRFFTVVGAPYVAERHSDSVARNKRPVAPIPARPAEPSLAASLMVLFTLIAAIAVFAGEISVLASVGLTNEVMAAVVE